MNWRKIGHYTWMLTFEIFAWCGVGFAFWAIGAGALIFITWGEVVGDTLWFSMRVAISLGFLVGVIRDFFLLKRFLKEEGLV